MRKIKKGEEEEIEEGEGKKRRKERKIVSAQDA